MAAITLDIGGNTSKLDRDIQKTVNKVYTINLKTKGDQPLGRITGSVNEFTKSLDASNARVIAFGASAGIIFGVERAFRALVTSTIEVQKSLADINVILNVSTSQLNSFGAELFNIAKNTGQSFQAVATAATEFSRQGLGVAETLKRTNEALILSRLSGLDTAKSVETLTAAVNSFASQAVTATEIVNKFATVDAAFAVSSADLADAISRVGSSAAQSGVSLNELIAIVTSAQQTTARGGAVIGNSFKTIFTRLQREKVVDLLGSLGISGTDSSGQIKSTIQLLTELGAVYDTLGSQQQAYVAEQVGGVFQINILKAALADLGKEYSIYNSALNVAASATDQAIQRNEELNKTYAAQINALQQNATQLAALAGERVLGPSIDRLVGGTNQLLAGLTEDDGKNVGTTLGRGILDGLGQFLAGPGLALIGGVLLKLFGDLAKFATGSVKQLLGLNSAAQQQATLQQSISQILAKNPELINLAVQSENGLNVAANTVLQSLKAQTVELQKQQTVAGQIAKQLYATGGVRVKGGIPTAPTTAKTKASGFIPNFASNKEKMAETVSAYQTGYEPGRIFKERLFDGQGGSFLATVNSAESINTIVGPNGNKGTFVIPPTVAGKGFIPNFAREKIINEKPFGYLVPSLSGGGQIQPGTFKGRKFSGGKAYAPDIKRASKVSDPIENSVTNSVIRAAANYSQQLQPLGRSVGENEIREGFKSVAGAKGALQGAVGSAFEVAIVKSLDFKAAQREKGGDFDVRGGEGLGKIVKLFNIPGVRLADFKVSTSRDNIDSFRDKILKEIGAGTFSEKEQRSNARSLALRELRNDPKWKDTAFREDGSLRTGASLPREFQAALDKKTDEITQNRFGKKLSPKVRASGYIPNFAAMIKDGVARERAAGIPQSQIYLAQEDALLSANPFGLGVFNKQDEPSDAARKNQMNKRGFKASGYVPNFAEGDSESSTSNLSSVIGALSTELLLLAGALSFAKTDYKNSLDELISKNRESGKVMRDISAKQKRAFFDEEKRLRGRKGAETRANARAAEARFAPGAGQKIGAGVASAGTILAFALPIITSTIKQAFPQDTKTGRVSGSALDTFSTIGSSAFFGATIGSAIPGIGTGIGAAVGVAAGALLTVPNLIDQMFTDLPEFAEAVKTASQNVTQTGEATQAYLSASAELEAALRENADPAKITKLQGQVDTALTRFRPEQRSLIESAATPQQAREAATQAIDTEQAAERVAKSLFALQKVNEDYAKRTSGLEAEQRFQAARIGSTGAIPMFQPLPSTNRNLKPDELKLFTEAVIQASKAGGKAGKQLQETLNFDNFTVPQFQPRLQKQLESNIFNGINSSLQNVQRQNFERAVLGTEAGRTTGAGALGERLKTGSILESRQLLEADLGLGPDIIKQIFDGPVEQVQQKLNNLGNSLILLASKTDQSVAASDKQAQTLADELKRKNELIQATENLIQSLQSEIRSKLQDADANREVQLIRRQNTLQEGVADRFTRPAELAAALVGPQGNLARNLQSRDEVAQLVAKSRESEQVVRGALASQIGTSIEDIFSKFGQEAKVPTADMTEEALRTARDTQLAQNQSVASSIDKVGQILSNVALGGGDLNGEDIFNQIKQALPPETDPKILQGIQTKIFEETKRGNGDIIKLRETLKGELKTLSKETTQRILLQKIGQAQTFGGTLDEFLSPPEDGRLIDKAVQATQGFDRFFGQNADFRFDYGNGNQFRYNYPEAVEARREMAPEFGRQSLGLIDALRNLTGYTPNIGGKAAQASITGIQADIENQIARLQEIAANPDTKPIVREEIRAAIGELGALGGSREVAEIKFAQRTGALSEAGLARIKGGFEDPVLKALQSINPQLAAIKSSDIQSSQDPVVSVINTTNDILNDILRTFGGTRINTTNRDFISPDQAATVAQASLQPRVSQTPNTINNIGPIAPITNLETNLNNNSAALSSLTTAIQQLNNVIGTIAQNTPATNERETVAPATQSQEGGRSVTNNVNNSFVVTATFTELEGKLNKKFTEATERILSILRDNGINAREAPAENR